MKMHAKSNEVWYVEYNRKIGEWNFNDMHVLNR